jgi:FAD/FMN-containing dehydrogenase
VTADGDIRTVNEESNPDLFWAIRGGGCNFGCVTEFVYCLHPQRKTVFAGPLVFPPPMLPRVVAAVEEWYHGISPKEAAVIVTASIGRSGGPEVVVLVFYNGEEAEGRQKFKKVLDVGAAFRICFISQDE